MARRTSLVIACGLVGLLIMGGSSVWSGQQQPAKEPATEPGETKESAWLHSVFFRDISAYDFYLDADKQNKLVLQRKPALRYPTPADYWGEMYVWTDRGRPLIVSAIWSGPENPRYRIFHEFHSLSSQPLFSGGGGATRWQPESSGIKFEPLPDAPEPEKNEGRRLIQMTEIAGRFSANMNRLGKEVEMHVIPQPFYIYDIQDKNSPVVDGALFALTMDDPIDPEVLLVLEAQRTGDGVCWQYAPIRFTNREAWVNYKGKEVWRTGADGRGVFDGDATRPFGAFLVKRITRE